MIDFLRINETTTQTTTAAATTLGEVIILDEKEQQTDQNFSDVITESSISELNLKVDSNP